MPRPSIPFERFLQVRSANGGTFSIRGQLAFLMNTSGAPQLHRLDGPGEEPVPLTSFSEIVRFVDWAPDGSRLLFSMDEGGSEREQLFLAQPDGSGCRALTAFPQAIHSFGGWSPDGRRIAFAANRSDPAYFDVYVMEVESGAERCVLARQANLHAMDWSPDGRRLLLREHLTAADLELSVLDLETGEEQPVSPHSGDARYHTPQLLPDGRTVAVCTDQEADFLTLSLLDTRTGALTRLLQEEWDVESCDLSADGRRLAALVNRNGWSELVSGTLENGAFRPEVRLELGGVANSCRVAPDGQRVAVSLNGPSENYNVWEVDCASGKRRRWTEVPMGDLPRDELVQPELVHYPGYGEPPLSIPAWLYRPRSAAGARLPVVVHVHGGPESQDRPNFSPVYQYLAHHGYAVLAPNVRGSSGYGNRYCHMDDREKRYDALRDVERAYHWLVSSGVGDPKRIGIMGGSYGGFTVLACLTRQPDLWAAGVDIVGIANFETFFQHTGPYRRKLRASEYGDPVKDAALLRDLSPIHAVDCIRAPLMVLQGANDPRVPQEESDQMVASLRARSHPVEYLLFPDEGHGIVKIPNRVRAYTAVGEFLERHLGSGE